MVSNLSDSLFSSRVDGRVPPRKCWRDVGSWGKKVRQHAGMLHGFGARNLRRNSSIYCCVALVLSIWDEMSLNWRSGQKSKPASRF